MHGHPNDQDVRIMFLATGPPSYVTRSLSVPASLAADGRQLVSSVLRGSQITRQQAMGI